MMTLNEIMNHKENCNASKKDTHSRASHDRLAPCTCVDCDSCLILLSVQNDSNHNVDYSNDRANELNSAMLKHVHGLMMIGDCPCISVCV